MSFRKLTILLYSITGLLFLISCTGGPVGGYEIGFNLNGERIEFPKARIYVEEVVLFQRSDGSIGYEFIENEGEEFTHLLFSLIAGKEQEPDFSMTWICEADSVEEIAGRNFPAFTMKVDPEIEAYDSIPSADEYIATYNDETCYMVITITSVKREENWINGVINGVYIEMVGSKWQRMEIREGRFGASYAPIEGKEKQES